MYTPKFPHIKKSSLLTLGVTSVVLSRLMFHFFDDPEGPNLLVVMAVAVIVYFMSLNIYLLRTLTSEFTKFVLAILIQLTLVTCLYFLGITF